MTDLSEMWPHERQDAIRHLALDRAVEADARAGIGERREMDRNDRLRLRLAQHISAIEDLYVDLWEEAANRADDSELPGGDAMVMLGPAANLEAWQNNLDAAEAAYFQAIEDGREAIWPETWDDENDAPPLLVLAHWEDKVREARDQPTYLRATVYEATQYLRNSIDWLLAADAAGRPNFPAIDELARDLAKLRSQLEVVLKDGIRVDRGVPCMTCGKALERDWGATEEEDRWRCRTCKTWSTVAQYELAVKAEYLANAPALTADDMAAQYRIKPGTLRVWAHRGEVRKRGRNAQGRVLFDVQDTLTARSRKESPAAPRNIESDPPCPNASGLVDSLRPEGL